MKKVCYKIEILNKKGDIVNIYYDNCCAADIMSSHDVIIILVKRRLSERVEYIPNKDTVKIMLEHEDKYIYPYLVFNVDYGYYRYSNCVNYENEINLNKGFIIDDDVE